MVTLSDPDAGHRIHREQVEPDNAATLANLAHGHLRPAAWRRPEVHHAPPRLQQSELLVELDFSPYVSNTADTLHGRYALLRRGNGAQHLLRFEG